MALKQQWNFEGEPEFNPLGFFCSQRFLSTWLSANWHQGLISHCMKRAVEGSSLRTRKKNPRGVLSVYVLPRKR